MTTYAFPSITPTTSAMRLQSFTSRFDNPITGGIQTVARGGEVWVVDMTFGNRVTSERAELIAFVAKLQGQRHRFTVKNHAEANRGAFGGTPLVDGADQTGNSITVDGCSLSVTNWIREGDFFQIGNELKVCTADASSDGSGNITISFAPAIRTSPSDNSAITTSNATGVFMLNQDPQWTNSPGGFMSMSISAIEDVNA